MSAIQPRTVLAPSTPFVEQHGNDETTAPSRAARISFQIYKRIVSPLFHAVSPARCLYLPTCSEYAYVAIARFGAVRGSWMALRRLARCHPWARGGFDPVPPAPSAPNHLP